MSGLDPAVLRLARSYFARPGGWTQGAMARDGRGQPISPLSRDAVSFDPAGAIARACRTEHLGESYRAAFNAVVGQHPRHPLCFWNNVAARTQAEVVAAFDHLIIQADAAAPAAPSGKAA